LLMLTKMGSAIHTKTEQLIRHSEEEMAMENAMGREMAVDLGREKGGTLWMPIKTGFATPTKPAQRNNSSFPLMYN